MKTLRRLFVLPVLALASCQAAANLFYEPPVTDPLDGYAGNLAQAGINTDMDWGPQQNLLLSQYEALLKTKTDLERRVEELKAENQNLRSQLDGETTALEQEKRHRAQSEAETETLRQRQRDLQAHLLSLSIEKSKLEQSQLLGQINALRDQLDQLETPVVEAAAPPRNR